MTESSSNPNGAGGLDLERLDELLEHYSDTLIGNARARRFWNDVRPMLPALAAEIRRLREDSAEVVDLRKERDRLRARVEAADRLIEALETGNENRDSSWNQRTDGWVGVERERLAEVVEMADQLINLSGRYRHADVGAYERAFEDYAKARKKLDAPLPDPPEDD